MPIPSPNFARKPYQKQAVQEIASFVVAFVGVAIQLTQSRASASKPSDAIKLAAALYGPDHDAKLERFAATTTILDSTPIIGILVTLGGLMLLSYFKYLKARDQDQKEDQINNPEGLRGCAHVLYSQLKFRLGVTAESGELRVTVHRVTEDDDPALEQVIDYIGTAKSSGKGRRFSIRTGVIGFAARTGEAKIAERNAESTEEEYKQELVDKWGYTREESEQVSLDRRTIIAVPIAGQTKETLGVVMVDCNKPNAFDAETIQLIGRAAVGFSAYIEERFK